MSDVKESKQIVLQEFTWVEKNVINNTPFYDGTQTLQEHIQRLQNNIEQIYHKLTTIKLNEIEYFPNIQEMEIFNKQGSLFDKASNKIFQQTEFYKAMEKLGTEVSENARKLSIEKINQDYSERHIQESDTDKILRLKIIETKIANEMIADCETNECKMQIVFLTQNPRFCRQLDSKIRNQCIIDYSTYDKTVCDDISIESLRIDCLNN